MLRIGVGPHRIRSLRRGVHIGRAGGGGVPAGRAALSDSAGQRLTDALGNILSSADQSAWASLPLIRDAAAARGIQFGMAFTESVRNADPSLAAILASDAAVYAPENDMKPAICHTAAGVVNLTRPTAFVAAANAAGRPYRIHTLNWPLTAGSGGGTPVWLASALNSGNWQSYVDEWFTALRTVTPNPISIDVVNEAIDSAGYKASAWLTAAGPAWMTYCFQKARELWPSATLYLCVEATEHHSSVSVQQRAAHVLAIVAAQKALGAPIDGVALQGHLRLSDGFDAKRLRDYVQAIRALGCKVIVSELDIQTGNTGNYVPANFTAHEMDRQCADLIGRYLDVVMPAMGDEFHVWTPSDLQNPWNVGERPGLWSSTYAKKPAYAAVRQALLER